MSYETHFEDGTEITSYLATAYAEGFCEGEDASTHDTLAAWSYLCGTKIGYSLQGFFGRTITNMIENDYMQPDGTLDWDYINELISSKANDTGEYEEDDDSYTNMEEL